MSRLNKKKAIKELMVMKIESAEDLMSAKRKLSKKYSIGILRNSDILEAVDKEIKSGKNLESSRKLLKKRAVRTMSGIAPVAVLTKPFPCPGKCAYCPTEKDVPQSYLSNEPAVMRAIRCSYDPYKQVDYRLQALEANGHDPNKMEVIVIGGTWSVLPEQYKYWYILNCFSAANNFGKKAVKYNSILSVERLKAALDKEQKKNERAKYRIIGLTLETRPDYINDHELVQMRELGCTRVELGVQAIDDKILALNRRGHGVAEIARATRLLRDYGFKITYHIMPALPGSTPKKDLAMFKKLFSDERFQPDQIKFYPTVVTKGSLLYKWWQNGKYKPYSDKALRSLIIDCKKNVPEYVRIIRLIRDIPAESIIAGNAITNLRQIMQDRGAKCNCIRCREAGDRKISNFKFKISNYSAGGGKEFFIQAVDKKDNALYGFVRLRLPEGNKTKKQENKKTLFKVLDGAAIVRELHVYGELVPVGKSRKIQHAGLGKKLMAEAEKIAQKNKFKKIAVISGVGVRGYYKKLGYKLKEGYMVK